MEPLILIKGGKNMSTQERQKVAEEQGIIKDIGKVVKAVTSLCFSEW